jgi:hypothetical protein
MEGGVYWHPDAVSSVNMAGNYVKSGPNTLTRSGGTEYDCYIGGIAASQKVYTNDTYLDWAGGNVDPWAVRSTYGSVISGNPTRSTTPFTAPAVRSCTVAEAYDSVLLHAGGLPRDTVGRRVIEEVSQGTGTWGMLAWEKETTADLTAGLPCYTRASDRDNDGMPDHWEDALGLNPDDSTDQSGDRNGDGYTNIEEYINALADSLRIYTIEGRPVPPPAVQRQAAGMAGDPAITVIPNPFYTKTAIKINGIVTGDVETLHPDIYHNRHAGCNVSTHPHIAIYDINGKLIDNLKFTMRFPSHYGGVFEWSPGNLPAGVYLLRAKTGGRTLSKKILKIQ